MRPTVFHKEIFVCPVGCRWAGACLACLPALASADSDGVRWSVTPYMWASETKFDLKSEGAPIGSGKVTFDDLMDATDASFQIASEAAFGDGTWSALVDVTYIETSDRANGRIFRLKTQSEQWFVDAAAVATVGQSQRVRRVGGGPLH